jgi:hypothetical protein
VNRKDDADNARAQAQLEAIPDWTDTMLNLEVPNGLDEHALERGLVSLARTSPDNFTKLMIRHVNKEKYPLNDFDEWAVAAHTLDHEHKTAAWRQLGSHPCKREVFWVLAGKDTKWIGDRLNDGSVAGPSELLGHVGFRPTDRPTIEEIAALLADRVEPELIISSLPDTMSGDEVEVAQYRLDESQKLAASDDAACTRRSSRRQRRRRANTNSAARSGTDANSSVMKPHVTCGFLGGMTQIRTSSLRTLLQERAGGGRHRCLCCQPRAVRPLFGTTAIIAAEEDVCIGDQGI